MKTIGQVLLTVTSQSRTKLPSDRLAALEEHVRSTTSWKGFTPKPVQFRSLVRPPLREGGKPDKVHSANRYQRLFIGKKTRNGSKKISHSHKVSTPRTRKRKLSEHLIRKSLIANKLAPPPTHTGRILFEIMIEKVCVQCFVVKTNRKSVVSDDSANCRILNLVPNVSCDPVIQ